jgi:hypothetical protein
LTSNVSKARTEGSSPRQRAGHVIHSNRNSFTRDGQQAADGKYFSLS